MDLFCSIYGFLLPVAKRVLEKNALVLEGKTVQVTQYHEDSEDEEEQGEGIAMEEEFQLATDTIKVTGIDKPVSEELLKMYFENKRKSGGGELVQMDYKKEEGIAVMVFKKTKGEC